MERGEDFIENGSGAWFTVGHQSVVGDGTDGFPAELSIQALSVTAGDGIEDEQTALMDTRGSFDGGHELGGETLASGRPVDEEFGHFGAVRLVWRCVEDQLNGPNRDIGGWVERGEDEAFATVGGVGHLVEEGLSFGLREGGHETD